MPKDPKMKGITNQLRIRKKYQTKGKTNGGQRRGRERFRVMVLNASLTMMSPFSV
jgi:hypothetical protein